MFNVSITTGTFTPSEYSIRWSRKLVHQEHAKYPKCFMQAYLHLSQCISMEPLYLIFLLLITMSLLSNMTINNYGTAGKLGHVSSKNQSITSNVCHFHIFSITPTLKYTVFLT